MGNWIPFLSYVFVTAFTPGPNNIMAMSNANQHGFKKTQKFILGVSAGFALVMLLCSYFNVILYTMLPKAKTVMSILGAAYMVYLAFKMMINKPNIDSNKKERLNSFLSGFVLQFMNPKIILYGITAISTFVIPFYKSGFSLIFFSMFLAFVGVLGTSSWAAFGAGFQKVLSKHEKPFNLLMSLLLLYCAVSIFIK